MIIAFEGIDAVGKSTQINLTKQKLQNSDKKVIATKEPGATQFGKKIRQMILNENICFKAELFLFIADRSEHFEQVLKNDEDRIILSDRSFISGIAYACINEKTLDMDEIYNINAFALNHKFPDKFIFLKADKKLIQNRLSKRDEIDKIEVRGVDYLLSVQNKIEEVLQKYNFNYLTIDASLSKEEINSEIMEFINYSTINNGTF